jgi:Family of unknown function (DUF5330)
MFLIRLAFWIGLVVLLLPTDEHQQAKLYGTAVATVERVTTFCDRNGQLCAAGTDLWATFLKKAAFGARVVVDLVSSGGHKEEMAPVRDVQPPEGKRRPEPRLLPSAQGTLTPNDLGPAWRGQAQRTGT